MITDASKSMVSLTAAAAMSLISVNVLCVVGPRVWLGE